jgi:glutamate decarboxylase
LLGHPRFFNQLSQGLDIVSLAGEWVTAVTNTNMFTYEIAPFYTLCEEVVLNKMREIIGWTEQGDGLLNPGGSISNMYAVQAAKHFYFPQTKYMGLYNMPKLVIFTSEHVYLNLKNL